MGQNDYPGIEGIITDDDMKEGTFKEMGPFRLFCLYLWHSINNKGACNMVNQD